MDRAKRGLPHLRVVRVTLRRTTQPFSIERTRVGCLIGRATFSEANPGNTSLSLYIYEYNHQESRSRPRAWSRRTGARLHIAMHARPVGVAQRVPWATSSGRILPGRLEPGVRRPDGTLQRNAG